MSTLEQICGDAKKAAYALSRCLSSEKDKALLLIADALESGFEQVLAANDEDLRQSEASGTSPAMLDRLRLTRERLCGMADAVRFVASQPDPVGKVLDGVTRPNGLKIEQITVPLGVVGIIYESRPNVTVDCAALCLKSGNACVLRGGSEAARSNAALVSIMRSALAETSLPPDCITMVADTSRGTVNEMMRMNGLIDVLIPRGGAGLIRAVVENSSVPVIETGAGNCHIFIDESADVQMAADITDNAKTSRPGVCNAAETLLVHRSCAERILPAVAQRLAKSAVELRGCPETVRILGGGIMPATEDDYRTEFNDFILAVKIVGNITEAVEHIQRYSTHHSEAIITENYANAQEFLRSVDSAAVYVNASTRFTDGGEFGLGAEIGISTQKLHARGPMGLGRLTSTKYLIYGSGQIR